MATSASPAEIRSARLESTWMIGVGTCADATLAPKPRRITKPATKKVSASADRLKVAPSPKRRMRMSRSIACPPKSPRMSRCSREQYCGCTACAHMVVAERADTKRVGAHTHEVARPPRRSKGHEKPREEASTAGAEPICPHCGKRSREKRYPGCQRCGRNTLVISWWNGGYENP